MGPPLPHRATRGPAGGHHPSHEEQLERLAGDDSEHHHDAQHTRRGDRERPAPWQLDADRVESQAECHDRCHPGVARDRAGDDRDRRHGENRGGRDDRPQTTDGDRQTKGHSEEERHPARLGPAGLRGLRCLGRGIAAEHGGGDGQQHVDGEQLTAAEPPDEEGRRCGSHAGDVNDPSRVGASNHGSIFAGSCAEPRVDDIRSPVREASRHDDTDGFDQRSAEGILRRPEPGDRARRRHGRPGRGQLHRGDGPLRFGASPHCCIVSPVSTVRPPAR